MEMCLTELILSLPIYTIGIKKEEWYLCWKWERAAATGIATVSLRLQGRPCQTKRKPASRTHRRYWFPPFLLLENPSALLSFDNWIPKRRLNPPRSAANHLQLRAFRSSKLSKFRETKRSGVQPEWPGKMKTESQNGTGWKGLLEMIWSIPPLFKQGPMVLVAQDHVQISFSLFPQVETPQPLWATYASAQSLSQCKTVPWCSEGTSCVSVSTHGLLALGNGGVILWAFLKTGVIFALLQCSGTSHSHHNHPKMFNMVSKHSFVRQVRTYMNSLLWCVCKFW